MEEIIKRLTENHQIESAKSILESNGYKVRKLKEAESEENRRSEKHNYNEFKNNMRANPLYNKLSNLCTQHGYTLGFAYIENGKKEITIRENKKYHPEIYYNSYRMTRNGNSDKGDFFEIQTGAYGTLPTEEFKLFMDAQQDAYTLVLAFEKADLNELYDLNREDYE